MSHFLALLLLVLSPLAQEAADEPTNGQGSSWKSLAALQLGRGIKTDALAAARAALAATEAEAERADLQARIRDLQSDIAKIDADFESIATGIDLQEFDLSPPEEFDLQAEVMKLVQPLVEELKDATEAPRQIDRLRGRVDYLADREELATEAISSIEKLLSELGSEDPHSLREALERSRNAWQGRISDVQGQRTVTRFQLDKRLSQRKPILQSAQGALSDFFRTRGLNLLLAIATFVLVLLILRGMHRYVAKLIPGRKGGERHIYARIVDVLYFLFVGLFALVAALLVLYASGDWVLLGLAILFLLGVMWAFKAAIPMYVEQIRLLLNLGTVRERERLMIDGIPYRVSKLSFYALLSNPELAGGVRRLPIQDLAQMRSRTCSKDEIWFPSRRNCWVLLSDGVRGKVVHQSPEMVELELLGGARATYQTSDYLGLAPQNLSDGFRSEVRFGIDYALQSIATTEVPTKFHAAIQAGLTELLGEDAIVSLKVEFCEAGASSLDYLVVVDLAGEAAPKYDGIPRAIQRLCVDVCNHEGWGIPFAQLVVHRADEE